MSSSPLPPSPETPLEARVLFWGKVALIAAAATYLAQAYVSRGATGLAAILTTAGLSIFFFGKLVIFWGLKAGGPSIWSLALMTVLIDMVFAFALASGLRNLERASVLGRWLRNGRARAKQVLDEYPGFRRLAFFGVVAFVLLPIAGTGAITGSIVARLLGLSRLAGIGAVALASVWTACAFSLLAYYLGEQAETMIKNPLLMVGLLGLAGGVGWILYRRVLNELKRKT